MSPSDPDLLRALNTITALLDAPDIVAACEVVSNFMSLTDWELVEYIEEMKKTIRGQAAYIASLEKGATDDGLGMGRS